MALPTNPPISLSQIQAEFGAPSTTGITDFRRGGAYVPDTPANAGVPASGDIGLLHLLGATKTTPLVLSVTGGTRETFAPEPAPSQIPMSSIMVASVSGGTPPYTFTWSRVSGSINSWGVLAGDPAGARFNANVFKNILADITLRVTVTDSGGQTATKDRYGSLYYYTDI